MVCCCLDRPTRTRYQKHENEPRKFVLVHRVGRKNEEKKTNPRHQVPGSFERTSASKFVQTKRERKRTSSIFHFASQRASKILVRPLPTTKYHHYPPPLPTKHVRKKEAEIGVAPERNPNRASSYHRIKGIRLCV